MVWHFGWQDEPEVLTVFSDANWAGCPKTGRSTSGGAALLGQHPIWVGSRTPSALALISADSKLFARTKAATEGIGVPALMSDLGLDANMVMEVDASAALGVI